jgi:L-fuconolactonase
MAASPHNPFHGIAGRGDIDIVDAQLHLAPQPSLEATLAAMDALGIRSVVLDELWGRNENDHGTPCIEFADGAYRPLSPLAQAAALQYPDRFSWLQRITRRDPEVATLIPLLAGSPGCRSLRLVIHEASECALFAGGGYDELLSLAQEYRLPLALLARDVGLLLQKVAPRFPRLQFVVDHCGWVRKEKHWRDVLALARLDNTWLKWSHFHRAFGGGDVAADGVQGAFRDALGAFGAQRMLWAGDITHEESSATWAQLLAFVQQNPAASETDREWLLGRTARQVFGWTVSRPTADA